MGVGVGIKNENHTGGKILHGTSVQSIESIQTFQSIFSVHVSSEPMVSLSIRLWFPPDIFQSQFRMPLWQTNIRRRTPKPGPNFKPGESTIWPLTINTLQKNNQMIQIPEIWNCIGFLPCFEHPVHESTKVCQRWNATNDLSKSCTLMPQGLTASLRRTSTSNCGKHQLWAVVWYKDSCWPASTQVSTHEGRKTHRIVASPRVDLWRWIAPAKTFPPSTKFRQNFHMFFTFLTRCTLGMKRLELPQKRPEKCSFHRLSSNFHWFPQS